MRTRLGLLVLCCLLSAVVGCGPGEDYSTPKKAVRTFYVAMVQGDVNIAKAAVSDASQADMVDDIRRVYEGLIAADKAAEEKFGAGNGANNVSGGLPSLDDLEKATETIKDDLASVNISKLPQALRLKKVDGKWKVDLSSVLPVPLPFENKQMCKRILGSMKSCSSDIADRIKEGRFQTAAEARKALESQVMTAFATELFKGLKSGG